MPGLAVDIATSACTPALSGSVGGTPVNVTALRIAMAAVAARMTAAAEEIVGDDASAAETALSVAPASIAPAGAVAAAGDPRTRRTTEWSSSAATGAAEMGPGAVTSAAALAAAALAEAAANSSSVGPSPASIASMMDSAVEGGGTSVAMATSRTTLSLPCTASEISRWISSRPRPAVS